MQRPHHAQGHANRRREGGRGHDRSESQEGGRGHGQGRGRGQSQERGRGHGRKQGRGHYGCQARGGAHGRGDERPRRVFWQKSVEGPSGLGKGYCEEGFQEHKINAKGALQELENALRKEGKDPQTAFNDWCAQHADQQFPGLRHKAYAIPPFFFKCYPVRMTQCGCTDVKPCPGNFFVVTAQESDQKGDNAQRKVGRAFRLLNEDLERKGMTTLFIMTGVVRDNILAWVKLPQNCSEMQKLFPKVSAERPEGAPPLEEKQKRMETDLLVVHQKGVTFVQVKSCGANEESLDEAVVNREVAAAIGQLTNDEELFKQLMQESSFRDKCQVQKVVAVPELTRQQLTDFSVKSEQDVVFLCQDDLFIDDIETPEPETDLTHFRQWWSQLTDKAAEVPLKCSKEIIGKYAGLLSTPVSRKDGGFHHLVRSRKDAIRLTAMTCRRQMLTNKDTEWVDREREEKFVCLAGREMCGVQQLLLYKAIHFAHTHESGYVVVLYQSDRSVFTALQHTLMDKVMDCNVHSRDYIKIIRKSASDKTLLVIVGEVCAGDPWMTVLQTLQMEVNHFSVWFMADPDQLPEDFKTISRNFCEHRLDVVLRCPPAVQHLLHHVRPRRDGIGEPQYTRDTRHMEVPTNGPVPLCIRHEQHGGRIADCAQCACLVVQLLSEIVPGFRNVRGFNRTFAEVVKASPSQGAPLTSRSNLSVAVVVHCAPGEGQQAEAGKHADPMSSADPFFQSGKRCGMKGKETRFLQEIKQMAPGSCSTDYTCERSTRALDVAIFVPHEGAETQPKPSAESRSLPPIPSLYWMHKDLERYNDWNRSGISEVGSRCLSQLILIVP